MSTPASIAIAPRTPGELALLEKGKSGPPWGFLPAGVSLLRPDAADGLGRIVCAWSMAQLGLGELAIELADAAVRSGIPAAAVEQVRAKAAALPPSLIATEELLANAAANAAALGDRLRCGRVDLEALHGRLDQERWFRATDGNIIRVRTGDVTSNGVAWIRVADDLGAAKAAELPTPAAGDVSAPPPVYLEGVSPPWMLRELATRVYPRGMLGAWARLVVVQRDEHELAEGLAHADLRDVLSEDRIEVFAGKRSAEALAEALYERRDTGLTGVSVSLPSLRKAVSPGVRTIVDAATSRQNLWVRDMWDGLTERASNRDAAWWARRYQDAMSGAGDPLRVLVLTTRFATYVGSASHDLTKAFNAAGMRAETIEERDDHSQLSAAACVSSVERFDPDLIVTLNHPRPKLGGFPEDIPFLCWVQDPMPHLFDRATVEKLCPRDYFAGHGYREFANLGIAADRMLITPVLASAAKFHDGPVDPSLARELACDVCAVTNHGETPAAMMDRLIESSGMPGILADRVRKASRQIEAIINDPMGSPPQPRLRALASEIMGRPASEDPRDEPSGEPALVMRQIVYPLADRMTRHRAFRFAAEIAEKRGLRLRLYGRGWDKHPTLARYAAGVLEHAEPLRAAYASAGLTLHASLGWPLHQRVLECAMSGGLPGVTLTSADVRSLVDIGMRVAVESGTPYASNFARRETSAIAADCGALAGVAGQLVRLRGWLRDDTGTVMPKWATRGAFYAPATGYTVRQKSPRLVSAVDTARLFGDLSEIGFFDPSTLGSLMDRAVNRPAWRASMSRWIASRSRESFTYEAAARAIPGFIGDHLQREAGV